MNVTVVIQSTVFYVFKQEITWAGDKSTGCRGWGADVMGWTELGEGAEK